MFASWSASYPVLVPYVLLPLLIFVARCLDVGLSTIRIIFIAQGRTALAVTIGFFESLIWIFVIGQLFDYLDNPLCVVAYAAGFAAGNGVGLSLERRLAMGRQILRVILAEPPPPEDGEEREELVVALRRAGFGVTEVPGEGASGPVTILFTLLRRRDVPRATELVQSLEPKAFYSVEDVRSASEGVFPGAESSPMRWRLLRNRS